MPSDTSNEFWYITHVPQIGIHGVLQLFSQAAKRCCVLGSKLFELSVIVSILRNVVVNFVEHEDI